MRWDQVGAWHLRTQCGLVMSFYEQKEILKGSEKSVALEKFENKSDITWAGVHLSWVATQFLVDSGSLVPQGWGIGPCHAGPFPTLPLSEWAVVLGRRQWVGVLSW